MEKPTQCVVFSGAPLWSGNFGCVSLNELALLVSSVQVLALMAWHVHYKEDAQYTI